jgi:predicted RNase H-like nuclease
MTCDVCVVTIDQPTMVPNPGGMRPVDKVAASLISWLGGGVQPANRSKKGMFDSLLSGVLSTVCARVTTQRPHGLPSKVCSRLSFFLHSRYPP